MVVGYGMHMDGTWDTRVNCGWYLAYDRYIVGSTQLTMVYRSRYWAIMGIQ